MLLWLDSSASFVCRSRFVFKLIDYFWEISDLHNNVAESIESSSSHVWMGELAHKEGWAPKNWCVLIVVLEKTLEKPLDYQEVELVSSKTNQPWVFIGRTNAEAPIPWPPDAKSRLIGKDPDAGKDWGQEEKRAEDQMTGWHHWLSGHEFEQTQGDNEGQGSLVWCSS